MAESKDGVEEEEERARWGSRSFERDHDLIRAAYREANPSKLELGEVDKLLTKYAGQERLLLRRVLYRYGLDVLKTVLWKREPPSDWMLVKVTLRADGNLHWAGNLDARQCKVNDVAPELAGRSGCFAVFVSDAAAHDAENSLLFASDDPDVTREWVDALEETTIFFLRLNRERSAQREEAALAESALRESERTFDAERKRWQQLDEEEELEARSVAALSQLAAEHEHRARGLPQLNAELEAALDDALRHASAAADFERRARLRSAFGEFRAAVQAFVQAKLLISNMAMVHRPEKVVLDLINTASDQCKDAATACRARALDIKTPTSTTAASANDRRSPEDRLFDADLASPSNHPLLSQPRLVPPQVQKVILDADDV